MTSRWLNIIVVALLFLYSRNIAESQFLTLPCGKVTCSIYRVDIRSREIELYNRVGTGLANFSELERQGRKQGKKLTFATNAGIFSWTYSPLGLFIKNGKEIVPLNTKFGDGNFYMKPNGVGISAPNEVIFAISNGQISFYDFALIFRESLKCQNALYLDGYISKMYLPELQLSAEGGYFAAIFAVFDRL